MNETSLTLEMDELHITLDQELQQATVLENTALAILVFDAQANLIFANPAGQNLFDDWEPKPGQKLPAKPGYESLRQLLDKARYSHGSLTEDIGWTDKRVFSVSITPVQDGEYVVVLHDVSRFKELEKIKNEFIATASHDLRTPITSITGFSYLIKRAGPLNDTQRNFIERIQNATANMSELVENMLNLTKLDLGEESRKEEVDVTHLLFEITDECQPQAELKRQLLAFENIEAKSKVFGNAIQLRQALRNLIGNAIKYTPDGGVITVSLEHQSNLVRIKIKDTGYGIPSSDLPHIFDRFYRVRNNGHDDIEGSGLGLAIVKCIANGHGGAVTVESEVGKGSCFSFTLPLIQQQLRRSSKREIHS